MLFLDLLISMPRLSEIFTIFADFSIEIFYFSGNYTTTTISYLKTVVNFFGNHYATTMTSRVIWLRCFLFPLAKFNWGTYCS